MAAISDEMAVLIYRVMWDQYRNNAGLKVAFSLSIYVSIQNIKLYKSTTFP